MDTAKKDRFEKYLIRKTKPPYWIGKEKLKKGSVIFRVPVERYLSGSRWGYVSFSLALTVDYEDRCKTCQYTEYKRIWGSPRFYNYIYRSEWYGKWINGFYKKTDEFYFSLPWYKNPLDCNDFKKQCRILKTRTALRRLMCPGSHCSCNILYANLIRDIFGTNRLFTSLNPSITPNVLARICRSVMLMTYREIIDKYEKSLDWLMEKTQPKGGIIINRNYNYGQFKGSSGASKGRKLARECIFSDLYSEKRSSKENIDYMKKKGLSISYATYLKYKKDVIDVREPVKEIDLSF